MVLLRAPLTILLLVLLALGTVPAAQGDVLAQAFRDPGAATYYDAQRIWTQADSVKGNLVFPATQVADLSTLTWTLTSQVIAGPTSPATLNGPCAPGAATATTVTITSPAVTLTPTIFWPMSVGHAWSESAVPLLSVVALGQPDSVVESKVMADMVDIVTGVITTETDEDHFVVATGGTAAATWGLHAGSCFDFDNLSALAYNTWD